MAPERGSAPIWGAGFGAANDRSMAARSVPAQYRPRQQCGESLEHVGHELAVAGLVLDLKVPAAVGVAADADVGAQQEDHGQEHRDTDHGALEAGGGRGSGEQVQALGGVGVLAQHGQCGLCEPGGVGVRECGRGECAGVRREGGEVRIGAGQGLKQGAGVGGVASRVHYRHGSVRVVR